MDGSPVEPDASPSEILRDAAAEVLGWATKHLGQLPWGELSMEREDTVRT
jgi:hypothetical protein